MCKTCNGTGLSPVYTRLILLNKDNKFESVQVDDESDRTCPRCSGGSKQGMVRIREKGKEEQKRNKETNRAM